MQVRLWKVRDAVAKARSADPRLDRAHAYCARIITRKARSFHFAARFLQEDKRRDVYALYAFCRTVDDLVDLPEQGASGDAIQRQLAGWRQWLQAGAPPGADPIRYALAHAVHRYNLPLSPAIELLDGIAADMEPRHLPDVAALERYCYAVAGTVGIMMAALLGARDPRALACARDLGIAMQLTNVLRDVHEDLARGRIYLPAADMARYGYTRHDLERGTVNEPFVALLRAYIALARDYYAAGMAGICLLPRESRLPISLAAHLYAAILTRIEQAEYNVFAQRVRTTRADKLWMAARLSLNHYTSRSGAGEGGARHVVGFLHRLRASGLFGGPVPGRAEAAVLALAGREDPYPDPFI
jgi:phytoene synthase